MARNKAMSVFEEEDGDPRDAPAPAEAAQLPLEEGRFACVTQCWWRGKLWHVGDELLLAPGATPNSHFKPVK